MEMIHSSILRCARHCRVCGDQCPKSGCPRRRRTRPACFAVPRLMRSAGCSATRGCTTSPRPMCTASPSPQARRTTAPKRRRSSPPLPLGWPPTTTRHVIAFVPRCPARSGRLSAVLSRGCRCTRGVPGTLDEGKSPYHLHTFYIAPAPMRVGVLGTGRPRLAGRICGMARLRHACRGAPCQGGLGSRAGRRRS